MKTVTVEDLYTTVFDEENRLCQSNASSIEYLTNMKYILNELKEDDKILELGAATGRYTIPLAEKGYDITALEFVSNNVEKLQAKIKDFHNIKAMQGNAINLSQFQDESFDVVLNMGPLYHFNNRADQEKVIEETLRVLKPNGTAFFAFIGNDMVFVTEALFYSKDFLTDEGNLYNKETHKIVDEPFTVCTVEYIRELMKQFDCLEYKFIASDLYGELLAKEINQLSKEQFDKWMNYHFYMCEKKEILGASHHLLYVTKKKG